MVIRAGPFSPILSRYSLYQIFGFFQFHTEALTALLADDNIGFIVMDGNGALFGTLQGNTREVLHRFTVDLFEKVFIKIFYYIVILNLS